MFSPPPLPSCTCVYATPISARISRAKVITSPPASVKKPWLLWLGSWLWKDKPTCTTPQPSRIIPTARMSENSRVSAQRLTALLRQVSKRSPPNRTYTSLRIRLSRNQSNFPACNRSWQDTHNAIVFLLRPIMARSHAALPFKFLSFLT